MHSHNGGDFCKTRQRAVSPTGFQITLEEDGAVTECRVRTLVLDQAL